MNTRFFLRPDEEAENTAFEYTARKTVGTLLATFGIKKLVIEKLTVNSLVRFKAQEVVFFDEAPEKVRVFADAFLPSLVDLAAATGLASIEMSLVDSDKQFYDKLWSDESKGGEFVKYITSPSENKEEFVKDASSNLERSTSSEPDKNKDDDVLDVYVTDDEGMGFMGAYYDALANLLPVEGRDFVLNPRFDKERGTIVSNPKAYTKIGVIWLNYVKEVLPEYLSAPTEADKQRILNRPWNQEPAK